LLARARVCVGVHDISGSCAARSAARSNDRRLRTYCSDADSRISSI